MTKIPGQVADSSVCEVRISRLFNAPRRLVFQAWTDPERLVKWFAPKGCTIHFAEIDVREQGQFHSCIRNPTFGECWCRGEYLEVVEPRRLVFTMAIADAKGNLIDPTTAGHDPEWPSVTTVTVTFDDIDGKTRLTLHQSVSQALAERTGAYPSWIQMLDHLDECVSQSN